MSLPFPKLLPLVSLLPHSQLFSLSRSGTFHATDTTAALYRMVRETLCDETHSFELVTHPDRKKVPDSTTETLKTCGLVPTAIVNFVSGDAEKAEIKAPLRAAARPFS